MKNKVISILNEKGGTGKTTITTNLAYGFKEKGFNPIIVDSDPQGSARDWHEANNASLINVIGMDRETLDRDIKTIDKSYNIILIDGAPRASKLTSAAIKISDLIIIPTLLHFKKEMK